MLEETGPLYAVFGFVEKVHILHYDFHFKVGLLLTEFVIL